MTAKIWMCNDDFKLIFNVWSDDSLTCECGKEMENVAIYDRRTGFHNWCNDCQTCGESWDVHLCETVRQ